MSTQDKLTKCHKSIMNHVYPKCGGYNGINQQRSYDLIDRYTELKEVAIKEGVWESWCNERSYTPEHDAYDNWA